MPHAEPFRIVPAGPDAAGDIAGLLGRLSDEPIYLRTEENVREDISCFMLARDEAGRLAGCAAVQPHPDGSRELSSVCVLPELRKRGLGSRLVAECELTAARSGCAELWLATAIPEFFRPLGYVPFSSLSLPMPLLLTKAFKIFTQPLRRWPRLLTMKFVYMRKRLSPPESHAGGQEPASR